MRPFETNTIGTLYVVSGSFGGSASSGGGGSADAVSCTHFDTASSVLTQVSFVRSCSSSKVKTNVMLPFVATFSSGGAAFFFGLGNLAGFPGTAKAGSLPAFFFRSSAFILARCSILPRMQRYVRFKYIFTPSFYADRFAPSPVKLVVRTHHSIVAGSHNLFYKFLCIPAVGLRSTEIQQISLLHWIPPCLAVSCFGFSLTSSPRPETE